MVPATEEGAARAAVHELVPNPADTPDQHSPYGPRTTVWRAPTSAGLLGRCACLVDFDDDPWRTLRLGETLAARLGARLQVVCALAEIEEGTIGSLASQAPFTQAQAVTKLRSLTGTAELPDVAFVEGYGSRALHRVLRRQRADLLVVGPRQARVGVGRAWPRTSCRLRAVSCRVR